MANGTEQTSPEGGGDDQVVEKLNENGARKNGQPEEVFGDDSGAISFIKKIAPQYQGYNGAHLRAFLLKNPDKLNEVAVRVLDNSSKGSEQLANQYSSNPELYEDHKQAVFGKLESMLSTDVVKGETTRQSIVNRTHTLKTSDLSSLKKPKFAASPYDSIINKESKKYGLDPRLVKAVIQQESGFDPNAESGKGAVGLMQLMPETAKELGVKDRRDPEDNLRGGIKYLAEQLKSFDSIELGLAAYNAGPNRDSLKQGKIPEIKETKDYVNKIVGNYQELIKPRMEYDLPITDYRDIALENKDKYKELGLVTEEGKFKYDTPDGQKVFMNKLLEDEKLHKELLGDRYDVFQDKLANSHNTGAIDESNPDDMARAWAVFDKFGSEGLTHFLNVKQHYQSGVPVEEQDQSVQQGLEFIKNSSQGGFTVQDYIGTFFGSDDSPAGKFEITPVTRSRELTEGVPKDLNNWTRFWNPTVEGEEDPSAFKGFIGKVHEKRLEEQDESFVGRFIDNIITAFDPTESRADQLTYDIKSGENRPEETKEFIDGAYEELVNGYDTPSTRVLKLEMLREAQKENGAFAIPDLMRTIMANAEDHEELEGSSLFKIDYNDADKRTKVAIDVLRSDESYKQMFHTAKDGSLLFEPDYYKRIAQDERIKPLISMKWEKKAVTDEQGNAIGYVDAPGEQNFYEGTAQVMANMGYSIARFFDEVLVRKGAEWTFESIDAVQSVLSEEFGKDFENNLKRKYEQTWREHFDAPISQKSEMDDLGDVLSGVSRFAIPFGMMIGTMGKLGSKGIQAPWGVMKSAAKVRQSMTGASAANILGRQSSTFTGAMFRKMARDARRKQGWTHRLLKYSVGAVPLEIMAGERWSLLNNGLGDVGIEWALDQVGEEKDIDLQRIYRSSNRITQIGMDVLANEAVGLLADNLIGAMKFGVSKVGQAAGRKQFKGIKFNDETLDFEKIKEPMFASDTRRTIHNMFNGLQDMPIGSMGESMANRYTGKAFLTNPQNKETLSDVVVGFTEEAHPIMSNAKKMIRESIEYYDKRLGGSIRLSQDQINSRVDEVYDQFMDNVAKNMRATLDATGGGETAPLRIANVLEAKPANVKGTVPYFRDGEDTGRHLMTLSEAEELASTSAKYILKPASGKFARVFEIDDGLWSADLARRIKKLYKGDTVDDVIDKQFQRNGVGKSPDDLSQSQLQRRSDLETAVRRVFGREVEVEGNTGVIVDADEDGFVLQMSDGTLRRGVNVDEYSDQLETLSTGRSGLNEENYEGVASGGTGELTGNRVGRIEEYLDRELVDLYPNLDARGRALVNMAAEGDLPSSTNDEILRIAKQNGVKASINDNPEQIVNRLAKKGSGETIRNMVRKALDANDKSIRLVLEGDSIKNIKASKGDDIFSKSGLMTNFMKSINKFAKYAKENSSTARAIAKLLGVDNTDGYQIMGKNQTKITRFDPEKIGEDGLKTNFIFKKNTNGVDEHFINVRSINAEDTPSVWVRSESGQLVMNPNWRRIEPNVTVADDGSLPLYKAVEMDGETWYRQAKEGEEGVFINVQKPTKNNKMTLEEVRRTGIDAVEREVEGTTHYRLINEPQQSINPTLIKKHPSKAYNASTTVKVPSKQAKDAAEKEATKATQDVVREAGLGKAIGYGVAGGIMDTMFNTTFADLSGEDTSQGVHIGGIFSAIGLALGSKFVRTRTVPTIMGFAEKSVKGLFDRDFTTLYKTEKSVKEAKDMAKGGLYHDPLNKYDKGSFDKMKNSLKVFMGSTKNTWKKAKQHEYVMSSLSLIKNLDHPVAMKFFKALENLNQTVNEIASTASRRFGSKLDNLPDDVRARIPEETLARLDTADPYTVYTREIGPEKVRELFPGTNDMSRAKEQFDLAFFRLMNTGARIEEGELVRTNTPTTKRMYEQMEKGDVWNQLDEQLMNDPLFREYLDSHRNFFKRVMDRWNTQITKRIDETFYSLPENAQQAFGEFLDSKQTFKQWRATLSRKRQKEVNRLRKDNQNIKDLIGYHETKKKFTDLDGRYYPQVISRTKTETALKRYVAREGLENLSQDRQKELFDQYMADEMYAMNHTKSERRMLREYNADAKSFDLKYFRNPDKAKAELSRISAHLRKTDGHLEDARFIERNKDDFISFKEKQVKKNGELVLDENGAPKTYKQYFLRVPDDYDVNIFDINTGTFSANRKAYKSFFEDITNHAFVRNSNFLERPRIKHLPHEILETDIDAVMQRYSSDVGKRIHNAEHRMFDEKELRANYLDEIDTHLKGLDYDKDYREHLSRRMLNIYNIQNNIIDKTGDQLKRERKFRSQVDLFKNALFSRFGFGFGWYNMFEWAVVGPHLTSGSQVYDTAKLFTMNKQALNNTEKLLRSWDIVRKEIGSVNADFERYGIQTESETLNAINSFATKVANYVGDFSITKDLGGKVFGWDVRNWGMPRLLTDSFMGSNYVSTSIVAQASLGEARHLANVIKQLRNMDGTKVARIEGKTWTIEDAVNKLERLGISRSEQDAFIKRSDKFAEAVEAIRGDRKLNMEQFGTAEFDDHIHDVFNIMQTATENFHGTNKMYRPEGWNSPVGKALSTYSTYPFNFSMQTVNRRMVQPISSWNNKYKDQLKDAGRTPTMKVLYNLQKGNTQALRNMGLSDEAIEAIPVDAYRAILKHMGSTVGVSTAGFMTMDAVNDLLAYPINDATGQEQWQRLRYRNILNPNAPKEDQQTWADIDEEFGLDSFMNIGHYMLGVMGRASFFGRYGDAIEQQGRLARDGTMSLTPLTGMLDQTFKDVFDVAKQPLSSYPSTLTNKSLKFFINNMPVLGSNVYGELRKGIYEQLKMKRQREGQPAIKWTDETTGEQLNIEDFNTRLE